MDLLTGTAVAVDEKSGSDSKVAQHSGRLVAVDEMLGSDRKVVGAQHYKSAHDAEAAEVDAFQGSAPDCKAAGEGGTLGWAP